MSYGVGLRNGVAFALGTIPSLTSGGGLRPSLLLDFLSGSLDPRITFSRGTQAMQYGSDGTLQYAPNNLLTYSNQADNAAWTKSNSFVQTNLCTYSQDFDLWSLGAGVTVNTNTTVAPDGTLTADRVNFATGGAPDFVRKALALTVGVTYTISVYAISTGSSPTFYFDVGNGGTPSSNQTPTSSWQRFSYTFVFSGVNQWVDIEASAAGSIVFWGGQIVQGSVPGDYRATTSAALPVLYADYNGALRARKLCEDATAAVEHRIFQAITAVFGTQSFYVKAGERTFVQLAGGVSVNDYATFNLSTGTISQQGSGVTNPFITPLQNGWYRVGMTVQSSASGPFILPLQTGTGGYRPTSNGDGSSGIYIADAQLTPGYLPLAVTETTSAAVYGPRFDYDPSSLVTQNLLLQSNNWGATWSNNNVAQTPAQAIGPDGTLSMTKLAAIASTFANSNQAVTVTSTTLTYSIYAKQGSGATDANSFAIYNYTTSTYLTQFTVNYSTGAVAHTVGSGATATNVGNGIWRIVVTVSSGITAGNSLNLYACFAGFTETAGEFAYVYGAQLNTGSTALPYTATTTAPYTLTTARGLLIEEQRVNLFTYSNDFTNVIWNNGNVTVTPASTTSPEGVVNMSKLAATASAATVFYQEQIVAATSATFSIFVKQGTGATTANSFMLRNNTTAINLIQGTLNFSTGVWTYSVGSTGVVVTNIGNGIWRLQITATTGITSGDAIRGYIGFLGGAATAGDFLYAYGAQLEAGAFATSYIPTVASTATRNADSASITTLTPWFNAAAGTIYASGTRISSSAPSGVITEIGDGTSNNRHMIFAGSPTPDSTYLVTTGGVAQANISVSNGFAAGTVAKAAAAYAVNDFQFATNATLSSPDISGTLPTVTTLYIGTNSGGSAWDGWVRSIRYYPTRLPNASLQSITA